MLLLVPIIMTTFMRTSDMNVRKKALTNTYTQLACYTGTVSLRRLSSFMLLIGIHVMCTITLTTCHVILTVKTSTVPMLTENGTLVSSGRKLFLVFDKK